MHHVTSRILKALSLLLVLSLLGSAFAWSLFGSKTIRVRNPLLERVAEAVHVGELGDAAYRVQEETVHGTITDTTGVVVPHYYVNVCIGDQCLPIDPIMFDR